MEEIFDEAYDRYMVKKEGSAKQRKRARLAHAEKLEVQSFLDPFSWILQIFGTRHFWLWLCRKVMEMKK